MCRSDPDVLDEERESNERSPFDELIAPKSDRHDIEGFHVARTSNASVSAFPTAAAIKVRNDADVRGDVGRFRGSHVAVTVTPSPARVSDMPE